MKRYWPGAIGLGLLVCVAVSAGCAPQNGEPPEQARSSTETAMALDMLAASTIEALEELDRTATSAARADEATATQAPPTVTKTITPSQTLEFVEVEVSVDTNCRSGPNTTFDYVGALMIGERTQVVARTNVPNYYIVNNPDRPGSTCWLWDRHATFYGDPLGLPLLEAPATPTPAPATIGGWVFEDVNGNGKRDSDESDDGIAGVKLVLLVGTCPGGSVGYSTQTDGSGRYLFPRVLIASYCLTTDPSSSSLKPGQYSLSLRSGETREGLNFWR